MIQELKQYLKDNKIKHEYIDEFIFINNKCFVLVAPNKEGKLFTEDFILITDISPKEDQYYVFKFGGKWYYCDNPAKPELNLLKYIGEVELSFAPTPFLGIHGKYEILNGSRDYKDWCKKAKFLEINTLGICEKNTLAGTLSFQIACKESGIKPVIGATYTVDRNDYKYDVKCYVKNEKGWENILLINKEVRISNNGYIFEKDFLKLQEGLVIVVDPKSIEFDKVFPLDINKDIYYQLDTCEYINNDRDKWYLENLKKFVQSDIFPIVITDAYYLDKEDSHIKKKLNLISGKIEYEANNQYFKPIDDYITELHSLFNPEDDRFVDILERAIANTKNISKVCDFEIQTGVKHLPKYKMTNEEKKKYKNNDELFWSLIEEGLSKKENVDIDKYVSRIEKEVEIIDHGNLKDYFLINYDQVKWCKENNILTGLSRGSAAGFLTSNLLDITKLDPFDYNLIAERFLTKERAKNKIADIDIDHEQGRRDDVKNYLIDRYGKNQCCSVGTYTTLQLKGCIKELSRLNNIDFGTSNMVTRSLKLEDKEWSDIFKRASKDKILKNFILKHPNIINDIRLMLGCIKSESIHASAFIITPEDKKVMEWIPTRKEIKDDKEIYISEWEGYDLEDAGYLKQDVLGLSTLDQIKEKFDLIEKYEGVKSTFGKIPLDDPKTFHMFSDGYNCNVFQFEADGLSNYTKQLKPSNISDIIATVALYRPGAIENNFHNEYILLKNGEKEPDYYWGCEEITKDTYGLPIYQEQIMKICQEVGGFDLASTDEIRRGLGKKKIEVIQPFKEKFIENAVKNGCPENEAIDIWNMMEKFAGYSFNLSHAASYGITGYVTQWIKANYPIYSWIVGFSYASENEIAGYISEIQKTGDILVTPPEINTSSNTFKADFTKNSIRWSLSSIKQCGDKAVEEILEIREEGEYFSFDEFLSKHDFKGSKVNKLVIENLVLSGSFDEIENIKKPTQRLRLIEYYRDKFKVKVDKSKDKFHTDVDYLDEDWWWLLQQKLVSGFAIFPYEQLLNEAIESGDNIDVALFQDEDMEGKNVKVGGYIQNIDVKNSKNGDWAKITLESNYQFIIITVFQSEWNVMKKDFEDAEKKVALFSGIVNRYKDNNGLILTSNSEYLILE
jgi:DNA polymerase-3 subunit alpha